MQHSTLQSPSLVIRLGRSVQTFLAHDASTGTDEVGTHETNIGMSVPANLREAFRTQPLLSRDYASVTVLADVDVLVMPEDEFEEADSSTIYRHTFSGHDNDVVRHCPLERLHAVALLGLERDLLTVMSDHYPHAVFLPVCLPVWEHFSQQGETSRQRLYGYFYDERLCVFSFSKSRMKFCNTFSATHAHDALFYLLSVFSQMGMKADRDEVVLLGTTPQQKWISDSLLGYVQRVERGDIPLPSSLPLDMTLFFPPQP